MIGSRVARRFYAAYFNVNDIVLYGKWKNHRGKIVKIDQDKWGNPTIEIEPIPKGRKQNKVMGLFKVWRADVKEEAMKKQLEEEKAKKASEDVGQALFSDWAKTLDKGAQGLDFKNPEDRVTYRLRMQSALKRLSRRHLQALVTNMDAPKSTAGKSLILDVANAYIDGKRVKMARKLKSIVARYITANGIPLGKTFTMGTVRIHRFQEVFKVWDLTNAGRRGKKVRVMSLSLSQPYHEEEWMENMSKALVDCDSYDKVKALVNDLLRDYPGEINIREYDERGIDVEPAGSKMSLKTNTSLVIEAAPNEFRVLNKVPLTHPKTGDPIGFQDTNYYSKDKKGAGAFFVWLQANLARVNSMSMNDLRNLWNDLDVKYDYH